ncbi:hypothetical protein K2173_021638 [Erythroxylum novogranatense]|uniref:Uncharacterized protein n=1 Tax=Erythroxylum novogranatense TaxID=1862640 RepID=A0AAV8TGW7_9ROSI|nr:hypothetical protein K2173_021638 [Erythroxylum novogranatense]
MMHPCMPSEDDMRGLPSRCGIVGHSPTTYAKKSGATAEAASPSTTSGAGATEQGEPLEPGVTSRIDGTSNDYGPWTNVQRRHPRPSVKGRTQTGASDSRGASVQEGSRFAALHVVEEGLALGHPSKTPAVLPMHSEMVCDRQIIEVPDQAPGEQTSPMVGVEEPGTGSGLPELPPTDPPDVSMTTTGLDDNPNLLQESSLDPAPHAEERGEPCVESGTTDPR